MVWKLRELFGRRREQTQPPAKPADTQESKPSTSAEAPTGINERGPFDLWNKCLSESASVELKFEIDKDGQRRALTPRGKNEKGEWEFSKLPEIHAKIVRTASFLNWFGDWTTRDSTNVSSATYWDTGEPRPLVHVTRSYIANILEPRTSLRGQKKLWFAESIADARGHRGEGNVYFAFINLRNPMRSQNADEYIDYRNDGLIVTPDDRFKKTYDYCVLKTDQVMQIPAIKQ